MKKKGKTAKKDVLESLDFIIKHMVTKDDVREIARDVIAEVTEPRFDKIDDRLASVESKISGINRRLDIEAMQRSDLKLPRRVHRLEEKVFGRGSSQHPKELPF